METLEDGEIPAISNIPVLVTKYFWPKKIPTGVILSSIFSYKSFSQNFNYGLLIIIPLKYLCLWKENLCLEWFFDYTLFSFI